MSGAANPLKRFYAAAEPAETDGGFTVLLDGRALKTPAKRAFVAPTAALAALVAAEWAGQGDTIDPDAMPATRLANVAIDRTPAARAVMIDGVVGYLETDLLCHRAAYPDELARRQAASWDPPLAWARAALGADLTVTVGVIAAPQDPAAGPAARAVADRFDDFALTALAHGAGVTGSAVLAFAVALRAPPMGDALFEAVALDDLHQLAAWGEEEALRARVERTRGELAALEAFVAAIGAAA